MHVSANIILSNMKIKIALVLCVFSIFYFLHFRFGYLSPISTEQVKYIDNVSSGIVLSQIVHSVQTGFVSEPGLYTQLKGRRTKDLTYDNVFVNKDKYSVSDSLNSKNFKNYYSSYILHGRFLSFVGLKLFKNLNLEPNKFINDKELIKERYDLINSIYNINVLINILPLILILLYILLNASIINAIIYTLFLFLSPQVNIVVFSLYWSFGTMVLPFAMNLFLQKYRVNVYTVLVLNLIVFFVRFLCCFEYIIPVVGSALIPFIKISKIKELFTEKKIRIVLFVGITSIVSFVIAIFVHIQNIVLKSANVSNIGQASNIIIGRIFGNVKGNSTSNFSLDYKEFLVDYLSNSRITDDTFFRKAFKLIYYYSLDISTTFADGNIVFFIPIIFFFVVSYKLLKFSHNSILNIQLVFAVFFTLIWVLLFLDHSINHPDFTISCFYISFIYYFSLLFESQYSNTITKNLYK
jgi:hypothetical protein